MSYGPTNRLLVALDGKGRQTVTSRISIPCGEVKNWIQFSTSKLQFRKLGAQRRRETSGLLRLLFLAPIMDPVRPEKLGGYLLVLLGWFSPEVPSLPISIGLP
ncbi:uncharacterized protein BO72DRAFT_40231 [Aspergillus fijiensis CBS 313.89]|uniref:Uncharacterized protein n=1 Tax=Aspergillus fijiensis CBS 313.89 TaxID=1448319 RepID=A0A8G1RG43_9EURO|nr:uncharacterized protein BO72DRAFT_40231 [Aspergillus fijiensis CBS 313.89]RAK70886.1 hypothetical protein BO72DRAFT_40231 [Aspergillus fijiensis CBS 313.89]